MILKNPAEDLAAALNGQTLAGIALSSGDNLFSNAHHPSPAALHVQLLNSGGVAPQPYLQGETPRAYFQTTVQVLVWGTPGEDGYAQAEALTRALFAALQQSIPTGYVSVVAIDMPAYFADQATQRAVFTVNFDARYVA